MSGTLYLSDLDGTLLNSGAVLSSYTLQTLDRLTARGMVFSYATARSLRTARLAARGLEPRVPLIVYNGAFLVDNVTEKPLLSNLLDRALQEEVLETLLSAGISPVLFSLIDGEDRFSFVEDPENEGLRAFLDRRRNDPRARAVSSPAQLSRGACFNLLCIDTPQRLTPLYEKYRTRCRCLYDVELYTGRLWLELMSPAATKANGAKQLMELLGCDRLVVFGDGKNDMDLFALADERYAVANAVPELKAIATGIIGGNDANGVARWLEAHFRR